MADLETRTLDVTGATLRYDIRGELTAGGESVLMLVGSPMDASGFTALATYFTDRPVVTYDPRGVGRSVRTDGAREPTPDERADDLHQVIEGLGVGAVDLFGSSGGAVDGLALVAKASRTGTDACRSRATDGSGPTRSRADAGRML